MAYDELHETKHHMVGGEFCCPGCGDPHQKPPTGGETIECTKAGCEMKWIGVGIVKQVMDYFRYWR